MLIDRHQGSCCQHTCNHQHGLPDTLLHDNSQVDVFRLTFATRSGHLWSVFQGVKLAAVKLHAPVRRISFHPADNSCLLATASQTLDSTATAAGADAKQQACSSHGVVVWQLHKLWDGHALTAIPLQLGSCCQPTCHAWAPEVSPIIIVDHMLSHSHVGGCWPLSLSMLRASTCHNLLAMGWSVTMQSVAGFTGLRPSMACAQPLLCAGVMQGVYVGCSDGSLLCVCPETGAVLGRAMAVPSAAQSMAAGDGAAGDGAAGLHAGQRVPSAKGTRCISSIAVNKHWLAVACQISPDVLFFQRCTSSSSAQRGGHFLQLLGRIRVSSVGEHPRQLMFGLGLQAGMMHAQSDCLFELCYPHAPSAGAS